ncbi:MAG: hypothetical protein J7647_31940 [Cyanobacteria bacterium SBLK]|nr:hypothetical protein [Cyanobacteria bacterium SBLK]
MSIQRLLKFLIENKEWLFSGVGLTIIALLLKESRSLIVRVNSSKILAKLGNFKVRTKRKKIIENGDIRIIGSRACGKTTYLAALTDWHYADMEKSIQLIEPKNEESRELVNLSKNILQQGLELEPTYMKKHSSLPIYNLIIQVLQRQYIYSMSLTLRDYAGEFFEDLAKRSVDSKINQYLNEIALSSKLLLMFEAEFSPNVRDSRYALALRTLRQELLYRLKKGNRQINDYRIAIVFSKFDQLILKIDKLNQEEFARKRLIRTYNELQRWEEEWNCSIEYFFCSAFGLIHTIPEPNTIKLRDSGYVLKNPLKWKPFGLVEPILWLCTGQKNNKIMNF